MEQNGSGKGAGVPGWLVEAVTALARAQVERMRGLFHHFRDVDDDDQVQVGVVGVIRALPNYDTRRAPVAGEGASRVSKPFSTWATMVIKRRVIDLYRSRARRAVQDAVIAIAADAAARDDHGGGPAELGDEGDLAAWLRTLRLAAQRHAVGADRRQGRRRFTAAQEAACAALMWRRGLSSRAAAAELADRPELRSALALAAVPSYRWLARAGEVVTRFPRKAPAANNGTCRASAGVADHLVELHRSTFMQNLAQGAVVRLPEMLTRNLILEHVLPVGKTTLNRMIKDKRFPKPDLRVGHVRLWRRPTVEGWVRAAGGAVAAAAGPNN